MRTACLFALHNYVLIVDIGTMSNNDEFYPLVHVLLLKTVEKERPPFWMLTTNSYTLFPLRSEINIDLVQ